MQSLLSRIPKYDLVQPADDDDAVVTLQQAKLWCKVDSVITEDDDLILEMIDAAVEHAEAFTNRKLNTQTWALYFDGFPAYRRFEIPILPLQELLKFEYLDNATGQWTDVPTSIYDLDDKSLVPAINLNALVPMWPLTKYLAINSVHIEVVAGHNEEGKRVPRAIKQAIKRMITTWYDNRGDATQGLQTYAVPVTAEKIMYPHKVYIF